MRRGALGFAVLAAFGAARAADAELSFQTRVDYPAGPGPAAVAVARFNGDRWPDLLVANDRGIAVLLGKGGGTFSSPHIIRERGFVKQLAAADFDGDGKVDIVFPDEHEGTVTFVRGDGNGGCLPGSHSVVVGPRPNSLTVASVNRDAALDLIVTHDEGVTALLGDGHGIFTAGAPVKVPLPTSPTVADFTGSGCVDVAMPDEEAGSIIMLRGDCAGGFAPAPSTGAGVQPRVVAAGRMAGGQHPDLIVLNRTGGALLANDNTGGFKSPLPFTSGRNLAALALGDFNRDGNLDAAIIDDQSVTVGVFLGNGDGTFRAAGAYSVGRRPVALLAEDVNNDTFVDLVSVNQSDDSVTVLLGDGDGNFRGSTTLAAGDDPSAVTVGDFDGDGRLDLAVASENSNSVAVLLGDGRGGFGSGRRYLVGRQPRALIAADFDEDSHPDLAVANFNSDDVAVLAGDGRGGFASPLLVSAGAAPAALVAGDFNADGHLDIAVANSLGDTVIVLFGDGHGRFPSSTSYAVDLHPTFLLLGDLNRDGRPDLIAGNGRSQEVAVLHGTTHGLASAVSGNMGTTVQPLVSDDFNGDGLLDLVVAREANDQVAILLGTGPNRFSDPIPFATGHHPTTVASGDFNGDGRPDLAVVNRGSRTVSILLNTTTRESTSLPEPPEPTPPPASWEDRTF